MMANTTLKPGHLFGYLHFMSISSGLRNMLLNMNSAMWVVLYKQNPFLEQSIHETTILKMNT